MKIDAKFRHFQFFLWVENRGPRAMFLGADALLLLDAGGGLVSFDAGAVTPANPFPAFTCGFVEVPTPFDCFPSHFELLI